MPTLKITKNKNDFYQEGLNKALSDVMEHQISLRKFSEYIILTGCRPKNPKNKVVVL